MRGSGQRSPSDRQALRVEPCGLLAPKRLWWPKPPPSPCPSVGRWAPALLGCTVALVHFLTAMGSFFLKVFKK